MKISLIYRIIKFTIGKVIFCFRNEKRVGYYFHWLNESRSDVRGPQAVSKHESFPPAVG